MYRTRVRVAILGATGVVGQKLVTLLAAHPWFELTALAASPRSVGRRYGEVVRWLEDRPIPPTIAAMPLAAASPPLPCDLAISALDAEAAREVEPAFAAAGIPLFSNASAFRRHPQVPIVVPEVNPHHLALVERQAFGAGYLVTNPNCCVTGLVLALKPLHDAFGVEAVQLTTLQALSGAGYPGVPALDAVANVVPFIAGEEEKLESEPAKILGQLGDTGIVPAPFAISAQANRVPVLDGHLLSVSVKLATPASLDEVRHAWAAFRAASPVRELPSAPAVPLVLTEDPARPQPRRDAPRGRGMTVTVGRLRRCPVLDVRFVALVHNTVRGAAGGALLNAELAVATGRVAAVERPAAPPSLAALAW